MDDEQFQDAPEDVHAFRSTVQQSTSRGQESFIDDDLLEWSEPDDEESQSDDSLREEDFQDHRVEDEDWEITERGPSWLC